MVKDQQKQNIIISITNSIILFHYLEDDIMFATYSNSIKFTASDTLASLGNILLIKDEDGTFKGLKDKYKCLSMNNTNNLSDKVNYLSNLAENQLAGFRYSTTFQCKMHFGSSSYSCFNGKLPKDCRNKCSILDMNNKQLNCEHVAKLGFLYDGTKCDDNKVCLLGECVHINQVGIDDKDYTLLNPFIHCPQGFDLFQEYKNRLSNNSDDFKTVKDIKNCEQLIADKFKLDPDNPPCMKDDDEYNNVCCEECTKFKIKMTNCNISMVCREDLHFLKIGFNPCFNGGVVAIVRGDMKDFKCKCPQGFKGSLCMQKSGCDSNPCNNGGECIRLGDGGDFYCKLNNVQKNYTCSCNTE
jgi:hypothetical protein